MVVDDGTDYFRFYNRYHVYLEHCTGCRVGYGRGLLIFHGGDSRQDAVLQFDLCRLGGTGCPVSGYYADKLCLAIISAVNSAHGIKYSNATGTLPP